MSDKKWQKRLDDILWRIDKIEHFMAGKNKADIADDDITVTVLERHLSVIGEAVNFIPAKVKKEFPAVPWDSIYRMRNILVHAYDVISSDVLWETAVRDLPVLKETILQMKERYDQ